MSENKDNIDIIDITEKYNKLVNQRKTANKKYMDKISKTPEYKEKRKLYYQKNKEKLQEKSRIAFNKYYENNKDKKKDYYEKNKDIIKFKNQYKYYLKTNNVEKFKDKYPDKFKILQEIKYIN